MTNAYASTENVLRKELGAAWRSTALKLLGVVALAAIVVMGLTLNWQGELTALSVWTFFLSLTVKSYALTFTICALTVLTKFYLACASVVYLPTAQQALYQPVQAGADLLVDVKKGQQYAARAFLFGRILVFLDIMGVVLVIGALFTDNFGGVSGYAIASLGSATIMSIVVSIFMPTSLVIPASIRKSKLLDTLVHEYKTRFTCPANNTSLTDTEFIEILQALHQKYFVSLILADAELPVVIDKYPYCHDLNQYLSVKDVTPYQNNKLAWRLIDGSLPAGLSLSADGRLAGTPLHGPAGEFTVEVGYKGVIATKTYSLRANADLS